MQFIYARMNKQMTYGEILYGQAELWPWEIIEYQDMLHNFIKIITQKVYLNHLFARISSRHVFSSHSLPSRFDKVILLGKSNRKNFS